MTLPEWINKGPNQYDYAINGIPFMSAANNEYPYLRESITSNKDQFDTTKEAGEQSLQNWWYRSQSSFDLGANIFYTDTAKDDNISRRFYDSCGIDALNTAGEVVLQNQVVLSGSTIVNTNQKVVSYNVSESYGLLNCYGFTLKYSGTTPAGAAVSGTINWGGTTQIIDFTTDGSRYFILATDGVYAGSLPNGTGVKMYSLTANSGVISFIKDRLIVAVGNTSPASNAIYELPPVATVQPLPTALYSSLINGWKWSAVADGPNGIYFSGYSGEKSAVFFSTVQKDAADDAPKLVAPYSVAEFPNGETVYSMVSYLSVYVLFGTSRGVRGAIIDSRGTLLLGQETIKSDAPVKSLFPIGDFCYTGGAKSVDNNGNAHIGLYKINLSKTVKEGSLLWAYQKDLYAEDTVFNSDIAVTSITNTLDDKTVFTISTKGLYAESNNKVEEGWLETGKIRLDTAEDKIFQYIRVSALPSDGLISLYWRNESNEMQTTPLAKWYTKPRTTALPAPNADYLYDEFGIRVLDTEGSDAEAHPYISYRFVMKRGIETVDGFYSNTPILLSYQVKANPSGVKQHNIRLPLLALGRETPAKGLTIERSVGDRIKAIESAEEKGAVVKYQDFGTGETRLCIIEKTQFVANVIPENKSAAKNNSGVLLVTLRTIDPTNIIGSTIVAGGQGPEFNGDYITTAPIIPNDEVYNL